MVINMKYKFISYGRPLKMVTSFKYLVLVILVADYDWLALVKNLYLARKVWSTILRILSRERAVPRVSCFFFKAMVRGVLLFGEETRAVNPV